MKKFVVCILVVCLVILAVPVSVLAESNAVVLEQDQAQLEEQLQSLLRKAELMILSGVRTRIKAQKILGVYNQASEIASQLQLNTTFRATLESRLRVVQLSIWGAQASISPYVPMPNIALLTFDGTVNLSSSAGDGTWYTDRYAPAGFESAVFDGSSRLKHTISVNEGADNRTSSYSSAFYNTQGRKYNLSHATLVRIKLYVPSEWENANRRMAGFWATGYDSDGAVSMYPIIEFASDNDDPRFQVYDSATGLFTDIGLPTGFAYDTWYTLTMQLDLQNNEVTFSVGDKSHTLGALDTIEFNNVILQGHNTTGGVAYVIYWDDLMAR